MDASAAAAAAAEFCEWVKIGIKVYNSHLKHQVKLHSFPCHHRNPFFGMFRQIIPAVPQAKCRHIDNCCKKFYESAKLAYANKPMKSPVKSFLVTFCKFCPNEGQSAILP